MMENIMNYTGTATELVSAINIYSLFEDEIANTVGIVRSFLFITFVSAHT